jgi:hypothetical protein
MATHMLVVDSTEGFLKACHDLGVNGEGEEKAICLLASGANLHHAYGYRNPLIIHMIVPTIDCSREVQRAVQEHESLGAKVIV